jgi:hypothetical protein
MLLVGGTIAKWYSLSDVLLANSKLSNKYVPCVSMNRSKGFYLLRRNYDPSTLPSDLCLCEMVIEDTARMFLDFDYDIQNNISAISLSIRYYMKVMYSVDVRLSWKWSRYDTTRWHCIISGVYFKNCWKDACTHMSDMIRMYMPHLVVDDCVYRTNSSLRICYQRKYHMGCYIKRLQPYDNYDISDLSICGSDTDICITREYRETLTTSGIGYNKCSVIGCPCNFITNGSITPSKTQVNESYDRVVRVLANHPFSVPDGMRLDKIATQLNSTYIYKLVRIRPSMCILCRRVHTSENAYVIVSSDTIEVRCYRNPKDRQGNTISMVFEKS